MAECIPWHGTMARSVVLFHTKRKVTSDRVYGGTMLRSWADPSPVVLGSAARSSGPERKWPDFRLMGLCSSDPLGILNGLFSNLGWIGWFSGRPHTGVALSCFFVVTLDLNSFIPICILRFPPHTGMNSWQFVLSHWITVHTVTLVDFSIS